MMELVHSGYHILYLGRCSKSSKWNKHLIVGRQYFFKTEHFFGGGKTTWALRFGW